MSDENEDENQEAPTTKGKMTTEEIEYEKWKQKHSLTKTIIKSVLLVFLLISFILGLAVWWAMNRDVQAIPASEALIELAKICGEIIKAITGGG